MLNKARLMVFDRLCVATINDTNGVVEGILNCDSDGSLHVAVNDFPLVVQRQEPHFIGPLGGRNDCKGG